VYLYDFVGRGGEIRPHAPCAQGSFRYFVESACFQVLPFQADAWNLLRIVELWGSGRLSAATKLSTAQDPLSFPLGLAESLPQASLVEHDQMVQGSRRMVPITHSTYATATASAVLKAPV
jgi:hypothetical protein